MSIRHPKDFWSGLLFLGVGGAAVLLAQKYPLGNAFKMGPGYFPTVLGGLLMLVGVAAMLRSLNRGGTAIEPFHWRLVVFVLGATMLFGLLVRNAGLAVAVPAVVIVSAAASVHFKWRVAVMLAAGLALMSVLLFIKGLGLPIPVIGPWLGG